LILKDGINNTSSLPLNLNTKIKIIHRNDRKCPFINSKKKKKKKKKKKQKNKKKKYKKKKKKIKI